MIIRRSPTNIEDFVMVESELSLRLHELGFVPIYIDEEWIYYHKTNEILETIKILEGSK